MSKQKRKSLLEYKEFFEIAITVLVSLLFAGISALMSFETSEEENTMKLLYNVVGSFYLSWSLCFASYVVIKLLNCGSLIGEMINRRKKRGHSYNGDNNLFFVFSIILLVFDILFSCLFFMAGKRQLKNIYIALFFITAIIWLILNIVVMLLIDCKVRNDESFKQHYTYK